MMSPCGTCIPVPLLLLELVVAGARIAIFFFSGTALTKAERRLTQDLLGTVLCQSEQDLRWQMEEWDHALSMLDMHMQDVVSAVSCHSAGWVLSMLW